METTSITDNNTSKTNHLYSLDGLKGLAICVIAFCWHYSHFGASGVKPVSDVLRLSFENGFIMVELFYMLSGFGMMMGYGQRIIDHAISFPEYFKKRFKKIFPVFLFGTLYTAIVEYIYLHKMGETFVYPNFDYYHFLLNLFLMQDGYFGVEASFDSPSWCLSICFFLYIIFYFIAYRCREKKILYYISAACAVAGLVLSNFGVNYPFINTQIGNGVACFFIGVLLTKLYESRDSFRHQRLGYLCLIGLLIFYLLNWKRPQYIGNFLFLFIMGLAPMIILSILFIPWLDKVFSFKPFVFLGNISIAIYLLHFPIQCTIMDFVVYLGLDIDFSKVICWLIYIAIVISFSTIYHFFIEKHFDHFIFSFFKKRS